jgi:hypothetical protein
VCAYLCLTSEYMYDLQLQTKLQFRGRVANNACKESCTIFCQLVVSLFPQHPVCQGAELLSNLPSVR